MFGRKNKEDKEANSWRFLDKVTAIVMTIVYAVFVSNMVYNYIPIDSVFIEYLNTMVYYGPIVICAINAVSAVAHKGFTIRIIVLAIWVLIFLFSFFPDVFYDIIY